MVIFNISEIMLLLYSILILTITMYQFSKASIVKVLFAYLITVAIILLLRYLVTDVIIKTLPILANDVLFSLLIALINAVRLIVQVMYLRFITRETYLQSLLCVLLYNIFELISEAVSAWMYVAVIHTHQTTEFQVSYVYLLLILTFGLGLRSFIKKYNTKETSNLPVLCIFAGLLMIFTKMIYLNYQFSTTINIQDVFVLLGLITLPIVLIYLLVKIDEINKIKTEQRNTNNALRMSREQLALVQDKDAEIIKVKHDIISHLNMIQTFMNNDNYEAADLYMKKTCGILSDEKNLRIYSQNTYVNAVINYKVRSEKDIKFDVISEMGCNCSIDSIDLGILVLNLLDQRIAALKNNDLKKTIKLKISQREKIISILIDSELPEKNQISSYDHFYESNVINNIIKKYSGSIHFGINTKTDCGITLNANAMKMIDQCQSNGE